jgi:hypothetical protein
MIKLRSLLAGLMAASAFLAACARPSLTPDPNEQIRIFVDATVSAIPTATRVPVSTPYPTPTAFSLSGLFCEYQFCIGHPPEMSFFDKRAVDNVAVPSSYSDGYIVALSGSLFIQAIWQFAPGTADPSFLLDTILDDLLDLETGSKEVKLIRDMNVIYSPITSTATGVLPFGAAAAWTCGDRVFAWKVYTPQAESAESLFEETLARFTCGQ